MKGTSNFIMKADGFLLIHVAFLITIIFLIVSTGISLYHNEIYITNRQLEQLRIESLFQMGRVAYMEEQEHTDELVIQANYQFPDGEVSIQLLEWNDEYRKLNFNIKLNGQIYPLIHLMNHDFSER